MKKLIATQVFSFYILAFAAAQVQVANQNQGDVKIGVISKAPTAKLEVEGNPSINPIFKAIDETAGTGYFSVTDGTGIPNQFMPLFLMKPSDNVTSGVGGFFATEINSLNDVNSEFGGGIVISTNKGAWNSQVNNINLFTVRNAHVPMFTIKPNGIIRLNSYGSGTLTTDAMGNISASDGRLKEIVSEFKNGIAVVEKLRPVFYRWKEQSGFSTSFLELGFIAQDVKKAIPEAVPLNEEETDRLNFSDRALIAAIVAALKEQIQVIRTLEAKVEELEKTLNLK